MYPLLDGARIIITGGSGFIGTNMVDFLRSLGAEALNLDLITPMRPGHRDAWLKCDVSSEPEVVCAVRDFEPDYVLHLAARTDTDSDSVSSYGVNVSGTEAILRAASIVPGIKRVVIFSTQFVLGPGHDFRSATQYAPYTAYGESKVAAELAVRSSRTGIPWTIVRPTNVWGPWHDRYRREFWRVLRLRLYAHPKEPDPVRSYGYVGSVCLQTAAILTAPLSRVGGETLYVGDQPMPISKWVDAFSLEFNGREAPRIPTWVLRAVARTGDAAGRLGLNAPLTGSRLRSMTQPYPVPMHRTRRVLGQLPMIPLHIGVKESADWARLGKSPDVSRWIKHA